MCRKCSYLFPINKQINKHLRNWKAFCCQLQSNSNGLPKLQAEQMRNVSAFSFRYRQFYLSAFNIKLLKNISTLTCFQANGKQTTWKTHSKMLSEWFYAFKSCRFRTKRSSCFKGGRSLKQHFRTKLTHLSCISFKLPMPNPFLA